MHVKLCKLFFEERIYSVVGHSINYGSQSLIVYYRAYMFSLCSNLISKQAQEDKNQEELTHKLNHFYYILLGWIVL